MCEEAKGLVTEYMDALEKYERIRIMFLEACRTNPESTEAYRGMLQSACSLVESSRAKFQEHQRVHDCSEVIHLEDGPAPTV